MKLDKTLKIVMAGALASMIGSQAMAADYPSKPVTLVCWSSAGSSLDRLMRQLGKQLPDQLKVDFPVENRTGGSGAVAMAYTKSQPADAYTVLSTTASMTFTMAKGKVPFTPDDFVVLRALQAEPSSIAVRGDSDIKTLKDFVERLKKDPKSLSVGGYASAGFHQFVYYQLQKEASFKGSWVPFDGGNKAALALLGGHIDAAVMTPSSAKTQIAEGKIRLLGVSSDERSEYFPDVPTFKEQGYDVVESIWRGIMVQAGTPQERIDTILAAVDKVQATDEWKKFMTSNMQSTLKRSQEQMQKQVRDEVKSRRAFLEENGFLK